MSPFDAAIGASEPFSRRIARNTQALLVEEAHLARVIDPAGGSWYVESLTAELARAAWAFFQELEAAGGAVAALDSGLLAERIGGGARPRERDVATRPDAADRGERVPRPRRAAGRAPAPLPAAATGGLPVYRPAAPFEA